MVHKGKGVKGKQQTLGKPKNKAQDSLKDVDMFDMDSDNSDRGEQQVMKKTPGKTPKGTKSLGDKRVGFQTLGNNTPANKAKNSLGKKELIPGKPTALKEFKGLNNSAKKNGQKRPAEDDDDEDDDDDDDEDDDDDDDNIDMLLGGEDDEVDDDEEEDDDNDDDDDDDDEEAEIPLKKKQIAKEKNQAKNSPVKKEVTAVAQTKTPIKNADKGKKNQEKQTVKGDQKSNRTSTQSPKKSEVSTPVMNKALQVEADIRRDIKSLFVGNLPIDVTAKEIKALSADIIYVNLPTLISRQGKKALYAFLGFANEAKAEENYKLLQTKKLRGEPLNVDYTGQKRQNLPPKELLNKLFVASLTNDVTMDQVAKFFPKSYQITIYSSYQRQAIVNYSHEKDAAADLEACKGAMLNGNPINVSYFLLKQNKTWKKPNKAKKQNPPAKKAKVEVKQES